MISAHEPRHIKRLFGDTAIEDPSMGYDMKLYTNPAVIGLERKKFPSDFLASIQDGRLNREILAMREDTDIQILVPHGRTPKYDKDGILTVVGDRKWTKKGITNIFRTIQYVEGVYVEWAKNDAELVQMIHDLQDYFDKKEHDSLRSRPRIKTNWMVPSRAERIIYWMQGLPGVGTTTAKKLYEKFPAPLLLFQANIDDIDDVPRVGKSMAVGIYNFLRTGSTTSIT